MNLHITWMTEIYHRARQSLSRVQQYYGKGKGGNQTHGKGPTSLPGPKGNGVAPMAGHVRITGMTLRDALLQRSTFLACL